MYDLDIEHSFQQAGQQMGLDELGEIQQAVEVSQS